MEIEWWYSSIYSRKLVVRSLSFEQAIELHKQGYKLKSLPTSEA